MKIDVLIIEDDQAIRESLRELLEEEGFNAVCARNGQEGLNYLRQTPDLPKLILLDLMMPVMNGYSFKTEQNKDSKLSAIPTVIMTANGQVSDGRTIFLGAIDCLKKPLNINRLVTLVQRYCA